MKLKAIKMQVPGMPKAGRIKKLGPSGGVEHPRKRRKQQRAYYRDGKLIVPKPY